MLLPFIRHGRTMVVVFLLCLCCCCTLFDTVWGQMHRPMISKFDIIKECGKIDEVPGGDVRAKSPWNVAIFRSSSKSNSNFKFINSGVLISPTTVLTVFGGEYGPLGNRKYYIPPAESFIVAVGLNSTNLKTRDSFTQIKRVSYILPYKDHEEDNKNFHFWLYHLTTPINLSTPYARTPCLPFFLRGLPTSWQLLHGGYTSQLTPNGSSELKVRPAVAVDDSQCENLYKNHYGGQSADYVWCSKLLLNNENDSKERNNNFCLSHGSVIITNVLQRWFLAGLTVFVPEKKSDGCNADTKYIHAKTLAHFEWMFRNIQCGSNNFACVNSTCIPLHDVCNRVPNCPGDDLSDEDPIFCEAQNRCRKGAATVQCSVHGKCIRPDQLCNGRKDCDDGSDEASQFCSPPVKRQTTSPTKRHPIPMTVWHTTTTTRTTQTEHRTSSSNPHRQRCFPLPVSEGTRLECTNPFTNKTINCAHATVNSVATLSCEKYYSAKFRIPSIQMTCTSGGAWHPFRPFACEPNCGILSTDITALITHGQETSRKNAFPWHAAIFREGPLEGQFNFTCGGSLIERKIILTAAHCVADVAKSPELRSKYKIVLAPWSSIYEHNIGDKYARIFNIKLVRVPSLYDPRTLQSDIALVELVESVTYGQHIRPVCYLQEFSVFNPSIGKLGKVPGFGVDENGEISYYLKYASLPIVSTVNCSKILHRETLPPSTFCAGYNNGTSLCNGDSGGGIVFPERGGDYERYSIKGIVSAEASSRSKSKTCNSGSYSIYTHVDAFRDFILETLEAIEL